MNVSCLTQLSVLDLCCEVSEHVLKLSEGLIPVHGEFHQNILKHAFIKNSPVVKTCVRLCTSYAGGMGSVSGWGPKIPHAAQLCQTNNKKPKASSCEALFKHQSVVFSQQPLQHQGHVFGKCLPFLLEASTERTFSSANEYEPSPLRVIQWSSGFPPSVSLNEQVKLTSLTLRSAPCSRSRRVFDSALDRVCMQEKINYFLPEKSVKRFGG